MLANPPTTASQARTPRCHAVAMFAGSLTRSVRQKRP